MSKLIEQQLNGLKNFQNFVLVSTKITFNLPILKERFMMVDYITVF